MAPHSQRHLRQHQHETREPQGMMQICLWPDESEPFVRETDRHCCCAEEEGAREEEEEKGLDGGVVV